jgi:hypothetical protein
MLLQLFIDIIGVNTFIIYSNFFRKINLLKLFLKDQFTQT